MRRNHVRHVTVVAVAFVVIAAASYREAAATARWQPSVATLEPAAAGLVDRHCVACHNDRLKTGGLSLQGLGLEGVPAHAPIWE